MKFNFLEVVFRTFVIFFLFGVTILSRISISSVAEYDPQQEKLEIVDRITVRNPTGLEFFITILVILSVGTATEKIVLRYLIEITADKLGVEINYQEPKPIEKDITNTHQRESYRKSEGDPRL